MSTASNSGEQAAAKHEFKPLADSYPRLCVTSNIIGWGVALVIMLASDYFLDKVILPVFLLPVFAVLALASLAYSYYAAKACSYYRSGFDLMFKSGIWWQKKTAVSFSRIQHIDLAHGPLERKFGLATLKFFTAGGAMSDLKIPGLLKADAEGIREEILKFTEAEYQSTHDQ